MYKFAQNFFKDILIGLVIGCAIGSIIPVVFVVLDIKQLGIDLNFESLREVFYSQNIYIFSSVAFPILFSVLFFLFKGILTANKLLKNQEGYVKNIIDALPESIVVLGQNGYIYHKNYQYSQTAEEFEINLNVFEDVIEKYSLYAQVSDELQLRKKNGVLQTFLVSVALLERDKYILSFKNIQHLKDIQNDLDLQKSKLLESQKLSSLGEMAAGFAHEINNPLTIIAANNMILKKILTKINVSNERVDKILNSNDETVKRISKIINGLRNLARNDDNSDFELATILKVLEDPITLCNLKIHGTDVDFQIIFNGNENASFVCRPVQLGQVIINLLNNAFDAVQEYEVKWIRLEVEQDDDAVIIRIIDSGKGIPEAVREKIFEPMFTTKDIGKGTGLGLSLSSSIIQNHKGKIEIDTKSANTCFSIYLPKEKRLAA
jgi:signal transduction histidine kinase